MSWCIVWMKGIGGKRCNREMGGWGLLIWITNEDVEGIERKNGKFWNENIVVGDLE